MTVKGPYTSITTFCNKIYSIIHSEDRMAVYTPIDVHMLAASASRELIGKGMQAIKAQRQQQHLHLCNMKQTGRGE